jgi:transposase
MFLLLNRSFKKATDTPSNLLKNSLYLIAMQFVRRLTEKFCETGSVLDAERSERPSKLNDKKLMDISDYAAESIKITAQVVL